MANKEVLGSTHNSFMDITKIVFQLSSNIQPTRHFVSVLVMRNIYLNEPGHKKTCIQPGQMQTGLCTHRRWCGALNFRFRK